MTKKKHNTIPHARFVEIAKGAGDAPKPIAKYARLWGPDELATFNKYVNTRAYSDWSEAEVILCCQAVNIEKSIQETQEHIAKHGVTVLGNQGQPVSNPNIAATSKLISMQGMLLRRLGVANAGEKGSAKLKNGAEIQRELQDATGPSLLA